MRPTDDAWRQLISALHESGCKAALAITGGGSGAIVELLRVPGGSRLVIEAQVPYDTGALAAYLGSAPAQACSAATALALAEAARVRARTFAPGHDRLVGVGATAALASDRPKKGEHRVHIAVATGEGVSHCNAVLSKGRRDRAGEEDLVARAIVLMLARGCGVAAPTPQSLLEADDVYSETVATTANTDPIERLVAGTIERVTAAPDGRLILAAPGPALLMPGSFNPLHDGHLMLARVAEEMTQRPLAFELSITNVDKPSLASVTIRQRLAQFAGRATVEITRAPTFLEKSRLFPRATFVIGADTAERLVATKYYGGDEDRLYAALDEIGRAGARFLVAVRLDPAGRLIALRDVAVPQRYAGLFIEIPEQRFRLDASSTAIRTAATKRD